MKLSYKQQGMSLVELLVGMAIGVVILGGMMTVYMASKKSYNDSDQVSMMDESARTAIEVLKLHLEHSGYASTTGLPVTNYVLPPNATIEGEQIAANSNIKTSKDNGDTDTVGVRFKADSRLYTDCLGTEIDQSKRICTGLATEEICASGTLSATASYIYNSFGINTNTERNGVGATIPMLYCYGSLSGVGQVVSQGIEKMQINYGIDTNFDKVADQYLTATEIENKSLWDRILSIQVALLVRSRDPFYQDKQPQTYQLLDKSITTINDNYRRGVYKAVIRLRNQEG